MVDIALHHQLLQVSYDTYVSSLNHAFTGYYYTPKIGLIGHLYVDYAKISAIDLTSNNSRPQELFNTDKLLKILCMRLN